MMLVHLLHGLVARRAALLAALLVSGLAVPAPAQAGDSIPLGSRIRIGVRGTHSPSARL
jgi:hypothetical protein